MITAVVMVGEAGQGSNPLAWVQDARRAATRDLLEQLSRQRLIGPIILVTPQLGELETAALSHFVLSQPGEIHFGQQLAHLVRQFDIERLAYFGGSAAPLLSDELLAQVLEHVESAQRTVFTNNHFASDWAAVAPAAAILEHSAHLPKDNMLGWVLSAEAGLKVTTPLPAAATRLDIDTPTDLLALRLHPGAKPHLRRYLDSLPLDTTRLQQALSVLATPASRVFIAGRIGPDVWSALNRVTQCWLRVVAEERGMVSSGRQSRGEVHSLLGEHLEAVGLERFFSTLAKWHDAIFIDTRVLLAHRKGPYPNAASRFASDLGLIDQIEEPWLRAFTGAAAAQPAPIVLGGHALMSGAMLAFCELL